jgi:hypothetical protein
MLIRLERKDVTKNWIVKNLVKKKKKNWVTKKFKFVGKNGSRDQRFLFSKSLRLAIFCIIKSKPKKKKKIDEMEQSRVLEDYVLKRIRKIII